jgi:hypothetical protein
MNTHDAEQLDARMRMAKKALHRTSWTYGDAWTCAVINEENAGASRHNPKKKGSITNERHIPAAQFDGVLRAAAMRLAARGD